MSPQTTYHNPIIPGFSPDPSIILVDGIFYLTTSTFHIFPGLPIYASRDLRKWTHIANAISRPSQIDLSRAAMSKMPLDTGKSMVGAGGLFAPTIRYNKGRFYIICTNAIVGSATKSGAGSGTGSESETENFSLQNFIIHTDDIINSHWSDPIFIDNFHGIDPSLFFDNDNGKVYFQGCYNINRLTQPSCTIKQFEIDITTGARLSEETEIWDGHARYDTEGPHIYEVDGWYYLLVAEGGTFEHHMLCIARSKDIWGPYEDYEANPILSADGTGEYIQNAGHGELFQDGEGGWWAVGLGVRDEGWGTGDKLGTGEFVSVLGRESFLARVEWPRGGWPRVQEGGFRMEFESDVVGVGEGGEEDGFTAPANVSDVYIRYPDLGKYTIPEDGRGAILLVPSTTGFSETQGTCTFLGRRQRSHTTVAIATLDIPTLSRGIFAGLALYKDNLRHASLSYNPTDRKASLIVKTLDGERSASDAMPIDQDVKSLQFKIVSQPTGWTFSVSPTGGNSWTELGRVSAVEFSAREMTGPILGIFARAAAEAETRQDAVVFSSFKIEI
ncbi:glycosyl hydrolase [Aspergillus karnatakaensis]|uniref:glycosyl hydrolase n=1 Tax=Aspergillus karnatakaensis TaxID=1810916 RepID=UPI003CCE1D91